ncbi:MAG TPA: guanylate kinase [Thermoanaerobaculia bacterium]|nr:guanylate kinase [Thermoanaerobaculia bacterium]
MPRGELFILSAPSGSGKTTLIRNVLEGGRYAVGDLRFSVSHTTRPPRGVERDGEDYWFVDRERFHGMIAAGEFLEWAQVHDNFYGTSRAEVVPHLEAGVDVLMDIDVQGAERVMAEHPEAHSVFVMPPSFAVLRERLHGRGLDQREEIARRLAVSLSEIRCYERYEYAIVNREVDEASRALAAIVKAARHRVRRLREEVDAVVDLFAREIPQARAVVAPK